MAYQEENDLLRSAVRATYCLFFFFLVCVFCVHAHARVTVEVVVRPELFMVLVYS